MSRVALITGVNGQDGSYLAELLLNKGYEVHGVIRRASTWNTERIEHLYLDDMLLHNRQQLHLHYGDMSDATNIVRLVKEIKPDEIYNMAAQSHVKVSFEVPEYSGDIDGLGTLRLLEAVRIMGLKTRIYQASTSELYGKVLETPQSERTPFYPRSPYAVAKMYAYWITVNYREAYGIYACNGILYNHESPRRGHTFVTKKITMAVARIAKGKQSILYLGNLNAMRDWGYAPDYCFAMWLMLQQDKPDDYVIATGQAHSVREFAELAFKYAGIDITWRGEGADEKGVDSQGRVLIAVDPKYYRPTEVDELLGNPSKAGLKLGWQSSTTFEELVRLMVEYDMGNKG